jgi:predicted permease
VNSAPDGNREQDLDAELQSHLDMAARDRVAAGADPETAQRGARREFGNVGQVKEVTRSMWRHARWERIRRDLRYALRMLARTPGLTAVGVLTLALGIGANTAIFSVVSGVLLKPLAFPHPEQLVFITSQFPTLGFDQFPMDIAEFVELRERNKSFQDVGAYAIGAANIGGADRPSRVTSATASASLFSTLAVKPVQGRGFVAEETLPNASPVTVLSWELWQTTFGGRPVVGQKIDVDGVSTMVVGVMPAGFDVHDQGVRIWRPLRVDRANLAQYRGGHGMLLIGRLKQNVTLVQARGELELMLRQWLTLDGGTSNPGFGAAAPKGAIHTPNADRVVTNGSMPHRLRYDGLRADMIGSAARALWVLQAAVALVLLIACANLANLLLMRAETRHKELAVRLALGASRGDLLRQFLIEGLVLSLGGAIAGVVLAKLGVAALVSTYGASIPRATSVGLDAPVLGFTLLLAIGTGVMFGLAPLLHIDAQGVGSALRESGTRTTATVARRNVQRGLVIAEIAMAVMLVIGGGLLVRSLLNLLSVDAGFRRDQLTTFRISLPPVPYADSMRRVAFFENLTHQLAAIPGVKDAAAMQGLPPLRPVNANDTQFENYVPKPGGPQNNVDYWQWVTPTYLATMGGKIVAGRDFSPTDGPDSPPVVLINQTLAKLYYPGENPLGRRVKPGGSPDWFTIVGVVKDVKQGGVDSRTGTELYIDYDQSPRHLGFAPAGMNVAIRSPLSPAALAPEIRRTVAALDPSLPIDQLRTMDDVMLASVSRPRFVATLLGIFALIALTLAAVGTYGVLAYGVAQRRREIGIRMALGARANAVLGLVLRQGLQLAAVGIGAGLVGAFALTRVVRSLLFGVSATDPATFVGVVGVMALVAAVACIVPARRAVRVDPVVTLRAE